MGIMLPFDFATAVIISVQYTFSDMHHSKAERVFSIVPIGGMSVSALRSVLDWK